MNTWAPLSNGLVDSSIWEEPDHVFRVFMAMMSLKDADHIVRYDGYKLAKRIHMPIAVVLDALKILAAPDTRRPGQEFDGRRLEAVEDGWLVLNGEKYRQMIRQEMKKARDWRAQAAWRERQKLSADQRHALNTNGMTPTAKAGYKKGVDAVRKPRKKMTGAKANQLGRETEIDAALTEAQNNPDGLPTALR